MRCAVATSLAKTCARCAAIAVALVVGACASVAPRETASVADPAALAAPFDIAGRLSARRGSEGGSASFVWRHAGPVDEVDLSTPLGQTLARLSGDADGVKAQWPDGRTVEARDWNALTERTLGVAVPVQGLVAWLRGRALGASAASVERDAQGRPAVLRQEGWEILYTYPDDASTQPSRVTLRYPQGELTEVRLVIDRWQ
jgi:outer membrane lipoprotein LolB